MSTSFVYIGKNGFWMVDSVLEVLLHSPDLLSKDVLNILGMDGGFDKDFETRRLIEVGNAFIDLINGKIKYTSKDTEFMPGCR